MASVVGSLYADSRVRAIALSLTGVGAIAPAELQRVDPPTADYLRELLSETPWPAITRIEFAEVAP